MKWILASVICLAVLCSGCLEQEDSTHGTPTQKTGSNSEEKSTEKLTVTITSPKAGEILQGNKDVSFDASVQGGMAPQSYRWTSSIDGELSTSRKFAQNPARLSKGGHVIILKVTDANGNSAQGSVLIEVM